MTSLLISLVVGAVFALAWTVWIDLYPRSLDRLVHFPFKDIPATNGVLFMIFLLIVACLTVALWRAAV